MNQTLRRLFFGGAALVSCAITGLATAQPMSRQPPAGTAAAQAPPSPPGPATYDVQQLPETRGTVQRFTLTPRGDLDGFVLTDGTDVHLAPHLSAQLAAAVRPGDSVSVRGYRSVTVPLVVAAAVTDAATNETIVDPGAAASRLRLSASPSSRRAYPWRTANFAERQSADLDLRSCRRSQRRGSR
jgi:hypothetical protein